MQRAIGMVEFNSIARGICNVADQMVKISEVEIVTATSTCPGKYIAIVHGDVATVEDSVRIGERMAEEFFVDSIVIPNVDPGVFPAITGATMPDRVQAIGIMESFLPGNNDHLCRSDFKSGKCLQAIELRLGNGLGGKAYFTYTGDVAAVKAGTDAGEAIAQEKGLLVNSEVIPSPSELLVPSLL